jgi:hypothetical protein
VVWLHRAWGYSSLLSLVFKLFLRTVVFEQISIVTDYADDGWTNIALRSWVVNVEHLMVGLPNDLAVHASFHSSHPPTGAFYLREDRVPQKGRRFGESVDCIEQTLITILTVTVCTRLPLFAAIATSDGAFKVPFIGGYLAGTLQLVPPADDPLGLHLSARDGMSHFLFSDIEAME